MGKGQTAGWIVLATAAGLLLRLAGLGSEALWTDEALTLSIANLPIFDLLFRPVDPTPGLYYVLHQLFLPDVSAPAAVRSISLVFGVLTIPAAYVLGRAATDRKGGVMLALLVAVSPLLIHYSQEARAYAMLVFAITSSAAALLVYLGGEANKRRLALACFVLFTILVVHSHFVGWFWAAPACWIALREHGDSTQRSVLVALGLVALGSLSVLVQTLGYAGAEGDGFNWLAQASLVDFLLIWAGSMSSLGSLLTTGPALALKQAGAIAALLAATGVIAVALRSRAAKLDRRARLALLVAGVLLVEPLLAWLLGFAIRPILLERTALPAAIGFALLLVIAARRLEWRWLLPAWIAASAFVAIISIPLNSKERWNEVAGLVADGSPVITCPSFRTPAMHMAVRQLQQRRYRKSESGPHLTPGGKGMLLVESILGGDPAFARHDAEGRLRRIVPAYRGVSKRPLEQATIAIGGRLWVVDSQCSRGEWSRIDAWLGRKQLLKRVRFATAANGVPIEATFYAIEPGERDVDLLTDARP